MSVEIDPQYQKEVEAAEKESRVEIDSEGAVFSFLDKLSKGDLPKEELEEIGLQLKNLEKGNTGEAAKFFSEQALKTAEQNYGIKASNIEELKDRMAEARVGLDEEIGNKQSELAEMNAKLEEARSEGEPWEVKELELEVLRIREDLGDLNLKKDNDFKELQNLIDAAETLLKN